MSYVPAAIPSQLFSYSIASDIKRSILGFDLTKLSQHFTDLEIVSLQKAWKIIAPKLHRLSTEILIAVCLTNYESIEKFRDKKGNIRNYDLIKHTYLLLQVYGAIIKCNVDPFRTSKILEPFVKLHGKRALDISFLKLQLDCTKKYIFAELSDHLSPTTTESFNKLNKFMLRYFQVRAGLQE